MAQTENPYDNTHAESFLKTLKHEEVCECEYKTMCQGDGNNPP